MTVGEILSEFDVDGKRFDEYVYGTQFRKCDTKEIDSIAYKAEILAAQLCEDYKSDNDIFYGQFYFGPILVYQNAETGEIIEFPDRNLITADVVSYWETRLLNVKNIILKARYLGLIWEFKLYVTGVKCSIDIARQYIRSLISIVNEDYMPNALLGKIKAERAIKLSKKLSQIELLADAKTALQEYVVRHEKWNAIAIWSTAYRISVECPSSYTPEEQKALIADLEERFDQIYNMPTQGDKDEKRDPWLLMDLSRLLAEYYKKHSIQKIKQLFEKVEKSFDAASSDQIKLQLMGNYNTLHKLLLKYDLKEEASKLSIKIAKLGEGIQDEMQVIQQKYTITKTELEPIINAILNEENIEVSFCNFRFYFIPKKEHEKERLLESEQKAPLYFLLPKFKFDDKGRIVSVIKNIKIDFEGQLVDYVSLSMKFMTPYISIVIEEGRSRGIFTKENILSFIKKSPAFEPDRIPIIEKGLDAYFIGDYIVFIHLLVPQFERAIRNLLEKVNIPALKPDKSGAGFQYRTLDEMLRDTQVIDLLSEDFAYYLRILLTDNRGWNLRNDICHGLLGPQLFTKIIADRVIHVLLSLGSFRPVQEN